MSRGLFCDFRKGRSVATKLAERVQRGQLRCEEEEGSDAEAAGGAVPRLRRPSLGLPLQRPHVRGLQGLLQAEYHEERRLSVQIRQQLRDRHVHEAQVSGVPVKEVSHRRDETGVRGAGVPVRRQTQGEEGPEGRGKDISTVFIPTSILTDA